MDEDENRKLQDFKDSICTVVLTALKNGEKRFNDRFFRVKLSARFGDDWFDKNAHCIPAIIKELRVDQIKKMQHFTVCIHGMMQSAVEKQQTVSQLECKKELFPLFGEEWFEQHAKFVPKIIDDYMLLVNNASVHGACITPKYDMPLVVPSCQGTHPTCVTHAVAFFIAAHLHRLYGQAYSVRRDQILYVIQAMCGCWDRIGVVALVDRVQTTICENENVWVSNRWNDRRIRIKVSATKIDYDSMVIQLQKGMVVPIAIYTTPTSPRCTQFVPSK